MADTPKLTASQAAILRGMYVDRRVWDHAIGLFAEKELCVGNMVTDLGHAALAAYDAEQRRNIVVETLRKCEAIVKMEWSITQQRQNAEDYRSFTAMGSIRDAICALITKESSDG